MHLFFKSGKWELLSSKIICRDLIENGTREIIGWRIEWLYHHEN